MRSLRLLLAASASLLVSACGIIGGGGGAAPTASSPATAAPPSASPVATRPTAAATATATAAAKPTAAPTEAPAGSEEQTVWVGNTDGEGVYLRATPVMGDRLRAYADGTPLTIVGDDVDGDDQHWKHVRAPDGLEGYVPAIYTLDTPP